MKTQILLGILQLNKPLSTSYRSCKSSSLSFWSPNYGSNLHKGHFPSERACCDMIHAFCLLLGIWGCLWRVVINTASNSSFHKMLYSEGEKKKKIASHMYVISFPFPLPSGTILVGSFIYDGEDVSPVAGRHSGAHVAVLQLVTEWCTGTFDDTTDSCNCVRGGRRWDDTCSGAEG